MKYKTVMVRAVEGRLARVSPTGRTIPHDKFVPAEMTPYLDRLINHHGDVVVETDPERPAPCGNQVITARQTRGFHDGTGRIARQLCAALH
jgi:hypothetical protein